MKRLRILFLLAFFAAAFLAIEHRSWLSKEVAISVGLKAPTSVPCQIFYTDEPGMSFASAKAVTVSALPNGNPVRVRIPVKRLEQLRFDFGVAPGTVRAGPVTVTGRETRTLDWREFRVRHDIGRFDVDAGGAANVTSVGGDPYAIRPEPLGVAGRLRVNAFAFAVLVVLSALAGLALAAAPAAWRRFASAPRNEQIKAAAFLAATAALVAARFALVAQMPPWFGASAWDDLWFVKAADSLIRGEWLGAYGQHTLCKGCFGPMTMASASILGIPFLVAETILFVLGCAMFVFVLSRLVRNRAFLFLAFAVLLFNPTSISLVSFQRIYRNGMPLWQVPLVFGCLFMTYRSAHGPARRLAAWSIASGIALWAFQNTREDGIWLWPFALVCLASAAARAHAATETRKAGIARAATCFAPLVVLMAGNAALCAANWRAYGVPIRNDRDAGNYAKAMRDLYLMAPDPEDEARLSSPEHAGHYHNIYYSTLCKAYDASPTLASARSGIDSVIASWARFQGYSGMDLRHDHMLFAIRDGAAKVGIYGSLPRSERFFGDVHRELSAAFADGRLSRRGFSFTAMAAPFRWEFVPGILREWGEALSSATTFAGVEAECKGGGQPGRDTAANDMLGAFRRASLHAIPGDGGGTAARAAVERANMEIKAYSAVARWALPAALGIYLFLSAALFRRRANRGRLLDWWLLATGILGSILLHTACIAYMSATTFWATNYYYLAPSGQLALMFATVVAGLCVSAFGKKSPRGGFDKTDMLNDPHADEAALASAKKVPYIVSK